MFKLRFKSVFLFLAACLFSFSGNAQAPNILCGLRFGPNFNTLEFISTNSISGQTNTVTTLANTAALFVCANSAINYASGRYYYIGQFVNDPPSDYRLIEIDAQTGTILNSIITTNIINELSFHVPTQKLYGLRSVSNGQFTEFISVTPN
ncbi:MAG: hypothetical protein ACRCYO_10530, partial [Bacteroidia bacterium]